MIIVSLRLTTFESTSPKFAYVLQPLEVANTHHPHIILCPRFRATAMCVEWESINTTFSITNQHGSKPSIETLAFQL